MNVQAQMSGQVPNQLSQQNGKALPPPGQMPNIASNGVGMMVAGTGGRGGGAGSMMGMDPDMLRARYFMREKILAVIMQRQVHPVDELQKQRFKDIAERVEGGLYKSASNMEEYINLNTLEARMSNLLKRAAMNNHSQRHAQMVNSSSVVGSMIPTPGTMIPTPGMSHVGNSNMIASNVDAVMISSSGGDPNVNSGNLLSNTRSIPNGYQPSAANFSVSSGGSLSSMGVSRMTSQMIPTPGFNINSTNNQSFMTTESNNSNVVHSNVETAMASQSQQQKQFGSSQNSRILQNLGNSLSCNNIRPSLQQKPFRFANGVGIMPNNVQIMNESGALYSNSPKPLQPQFDPHQRQLVQRSFYGATSSVGSMMNAQNLSSTSLQPAQKTNSMGNNQLNMLGIQQASEFKTQSVDQSDKLNYQTSLSSRDNMLQPHQQNSCHQQSTQFQQQHFVQHGMQVQLNQHQQHMLNNESFSQSQLGANHNLQVKQDPGFDHHNESLMPQSSENFQVNALQSQLQQNVRGAQHLVIPSGQDEISSLAPSSHSQVQQMLHQHHLVQESQNGFNCPPVGSLTEMGMDGQWHRTTQKDNYLTVSVKEQNVQDDFRQRIIGQDEAQPNSLAGDGLITSQTVPTRNTVGALNSKSIAYPPEISNREMQFRKQQMWLLFLLHARNCGYPEGKCPSGNPCLMAQKLLIHMNGCNTVGNVGLCSFPRCFQTRKLVNHFKKCRDMSCPVCIPVKKYYGAQSKRSANACSYPVVPSKSNDTADASCKLITNARSGENLEQLQPASKRMKMEQSTTAMLQNEEVHFSAPTYDGMIASQEVPQQHSEAPMPIKVEYPKVNYRRESPENTCLKKDHVDVVDIQNKNNDFVKSETSSLPKQEIVKADNDSDLFKQENQPTEHATGTKTGKPKIKGVSLTELFTPEQVKQHIVGLRQWVGQSKAKAEKNQALEHSMSENSCQLCAVEKLTFEPPPIYCSPCGNRIKRNVMYYTVGAGETRHYFCISCYNDARGDSILVDGISTPKSRVEKKKNDEETEEWWVQCDKCEAWQHQICALFNGRRNDGGQAEYTCPNCYIEEVERGERIPLPQSAVLGAKDLPKTILSDHIEQRLFRRLKQERQERARVQGKSYDEVLSAESLVIRVVSSVDKKLEVKPRFLEIFREENYPIEFPYKSKVILLFQKIEGVEVCLFGMYVQEFGSESQFPNQRRVYLSYLDSVKYFRPEIKAVTGEALRTFVYHEILIGYLEYCKKRGFTSCYIWACPPLKGEDYILYCHPEIQKTPKSDKLREWYLSMLRKAAKENIVVDLTNLYDHFFVCMGECKAKVTAARLPYFDGDYWPGAAEDLIYQINQDDDGRKQNKKGTIKKTITKRALKASGQTDLSGNASKDLLLMHKLGETISPMKEDFIMVHLQHCCTHCCVLMVSGNRWVCSQCKNFQLCDKCYEEEQKREERERHPTNQRDKHVLYPVEITDVPVDTKDKDEILESEFFDTRQAFLSLCQGNHYQYDTLRRAKHSSMMVLYHLHNPTAPAFVTTCNVCHLDIEAGQGWRCETCPEYDVCNACYQKDSGVDHPHKLTNHPSMAERDAQNKEARQLRVNQLRKMLELLVHASQCRSATCPYPNCRKVKGLFRHGIQCRVRATGGCVLCKKMWYLLQLHARACKISECHVPRCKDLKEHVRRLQQQSDSRRRAAVMEMMRQRAAEVAGNSG